ncbi:hypothetical protein [Candidatus Alkanophaga liquidiphilum]
MPLFREGAELTAKLVASDIRRRTARGTASSRYKYHQAISCHPATTTPISDASTSDPWWGSNTITSCTAGSKKRQTSLFNLFFYVGKFHEKRCFYI